ncbi:Membrane protein TerC, possibly involved in tellurium resistance [Arenibacter palladensis]|jgi:predicted tellurium resistance membrane protein TerC|uniref:Membrane protein TerC, possibly involved in tellurium resistance n=1 Tax=Arenibacter palladensis TaxID=237373 RepID=A0A1M4YNC5_9FLAO|nr:TerC family protein [Arenibacter palladensis]MDO6601954.1 TerC family protein [Arenibacter palladensis]SHF07158.1 Membrane protein TerC, possibly involved in tellurium resistance [Arenibacter palladensis]|tara:strand:- start:7224 stop:8033 length:810 start_codon:yes stop_codon:yes gene_type:complete
MFEILSTPDAWVALVTLTFLEIVLGIDNIIFISIIANKLPRKLQAKATNLGLLLAMVQRIILLFAVSFLIGLKNPFFYIESSWVYMGISGQALILFFGGLFLLYKSTSEIHEKIEMPEHDENQVSAKGITSLSSAIVQIILIDFIFSIDSILTAVGMTNGIGNKPGDALLLMIIAVVISIIIMMVFANPIRQFISAHPSMQILALSFLILIGFMLIMEAAHLSHAKFFGNEVGAIPKGYLYFAIAFSLFVEFLNIRMQKNKEKPSEVKK